MILQVSMLVGNKPVSAEELASYKNSSLTKLPAQMGNSRVLHSTLVSLLKSGQPLDTPYRDAEKIRTLTVDQVKAALETNMKQDQMVFIISGNVKGLYQQIKDLDIADVVIK